MDICPAEEVPWQYGAFLVNREGALVALDAMDYVDLPPPGSPDIDIARAATMRPIVELANDRLGVPAEALFPSGITRRNYPWIISPQRRMDQEASSSW